MTNNYSDKELDNMLDTPIENQQSNVQSKDHLDDMLDTPIEKQQPDISQKDHLDTMLDTPINNQQSKDHLDDILDTPIKDQHVPIINQQSNTQPKDHLDNMLDTPITSTEPDLSNPTPIISTITGKPLHKQEDHTLELLPQLSENEQLDTINKLNNNQLYKVDIHNLKSRKVQLAYVNRLAKTESAEPNPWVDPTMVVPTAGITAGLLTKGGTKLALKAGAKAALEAAASEPVIGQTTDIVAGSHPKTAMALNMLLGLGTGALEKNASKLLTKEANRILTKNIEKETPEEAAKALKNYRDKYIAFNPIKLPKSDTKASSVYAWFKEKEYPIVNLAKRTKNETAIENMKNRIRRNRGIGGITEDVLEGKGPQKIENFGTPNEKIVYTNNGKSLKKILSGLKSNEEYEDYETLRIAKRDLALAEYNPTVEGLHKEESLAEIKRIEAKYSPKDLARLNNISNEHRNFEQKAILDPLRDSGWISKDTYNNIVNAPEYQFYASFSREMNDLDEAIPQSSLATEKANSKGATSAIIKKIKGSEKRKLPTVESTIANVYKTNKLIAQLEMNKDIVNLRKLSPDMENYIQKLKPVRVGSTTEKRTKELTDIIRKERNLTPSEFLNLNEPGHILTSTEKQIMPELMHLLQKPKEKPRFLKGLINKNNTIVTAEDGIKSYWRIPEDVANAMNYFTPEGVKNTVKILSLPAKLLRAGSTLAPEFSGRNIIRDQFSAAINNNIGFKKVKGVGDLLHNTKNLFFGGYKPYDAGIGLFHILKKDNIYHLYKSSGAEQSYFVSLDRMAMKTNVQKLIGHKVNNGYWDKTKNIITVLNPLKALEIISEGLEKTTRMGLFARTLKRGFTPTQAMKEAKEGTLDFARIGAGQENLNRISAFWNANLEGFDREFRAFKDHPVAFNLKALMGVTAPSVALWIKFHNDDRIKRLPGWRKNLFWNYPMKNGPIVSIPKPFEIGLIYGSAVERALDYAYSKDKNIEIDLKKLGWGAVKQGVGQMMPTFLKPIIENMSNYSFFKDRPLESPSIQNLSSGLRSKTYTNELSKKVGNLTDISPIKIDNWINSWGSTLGRETVGLTNHLFKRPPEVKQEWYRKVPIVKGFVAKNPYGPYGKDVQDFYDNAKEINQSYNDFKFLAQSNQINQAKTRFNKQKKVGGFKRNADDVAKAFSKLNKVRIAIVNDKKMDPVTKKLKIEKINKQMTKIAETFNKIYDSYKAKTK